MKIDTIDHIVKEKLFDHRLSLHFYLFFLHYAFRGLRELHFDSLKEIKTVRLDMDNAFSATLPKDYVDYVKIGIEHDDKVRVMGVNHEINSLYKKDSYDNPTDALPPSTGESDTKIIQQRDVFRNYRGGYIATPLYGNGAGNYGNSFRVIKERGQIQFDNNVDRKTNIYLEYITDGLTPKTTTLVNPYAANALLHYIDWQWKKHNPKVYSRSDINHSERQFHNQHRILRARLNNWSVVDAIRVGRSNYRQSIKR